MIIQKIKYRRRFNKKKKQKTHTNEKGGKKFSEKRLRLKE
jgi:hypothetical protein